MLGLIKHNVDLTNHIYNTSLTLCTIVLHLKSPNMQCMYYMVLVLTSVLILGICTLGQVVIFLRFVNGFLRGLSTHE
jgi:hypothetical protein